MLGVVVAFHNKENAINIRNLLTRNGIEVLGVCTTGSQVLSLMESVDEGVVVCGYKLKDVVYSQLREMLPKEYDLLLVATADKLAREPMDGVVNLAMPLKAYDLLNTLQMMLKKIHALRKKKRQALKNRNPKQEALVRKAKALLMDRNHMTEEEAHRYLQKTSMDSGNSMIETAEMILYMMGQ